MSIQTNNQVDKYFLNVVISNFHTRV